MKTKTTSLTLALLFTAFTGASIMAQSQRAIDAEGYLSLNDAEHPCISETEYQQMEAEMNKNRTMLGLDKKNTAKIQQTLFEWPLRPASNATDCGYYYVAAYVDKNTNSGQIQDWNCGTRTYDGHRGIDIVPWPFIWNKMDNNLAEVIAAAPGVIIAKVDGNPDRVCNGVGGGSNSNNYITVQHADGSTALYVHMKTGSLTSKIVGDSVKTGDFLGITGSAGQSTGVHLHFEVRTNGTFNSYIDPNYGSCNTGIGSTWWANQRPYVEPQLMKLSIHDAWPYMASCPVTTDTVHERYTYPFNYGSQVAFYACSKHVVTGDAWNFRILDPANAVIDTWSYSSTSNRTTSTLGWFKNLPATPGVYTFEGTFAGDTCRVNFTITGATGVKSEESNLCQVFPNPAKEQVNLIFSEKIQKATVQLCNELGQEVMLQQIKESEGLQLNTSVLSPGVYIVKVSSDRFSLQRKLVIE